MGKDVKNYGLTNTISELWKWNQIVEKEHLP
jgi:hypothetical protein